MRESDGWSRHEHHTATQRTFFANVLRGRRAGDAAGAGGMAPGPPLLTREDNDTAWNGTSSDRYGVVGAEDPFPRPPPHAGSR